MFERKFLDKQQAKPDRTGSTVTNVSYPHPTTTTGTTTAKLIVTHI